MSSDGRRKETRGWATTGGTHRSSGQVVVIDDTPLISGAVEIVEDAPTGVQPVRARKSTLETFNEEMAILDRPLDSEVEYIDEAPPPSRLKRMRALIGVVMVMGVGAGLFLSRRQPAVASIIAPAQPSQAPAMASEHVLAAQAAGARAAPPTQAVSPTADEDKRSIKDDQAVATGPTSRGREKTTTKGGHAKHGRTMAKHARHHNFIKHAGTGTRARSRHEG